VVLGLVGALAIGGVSAASAPNRTPTPPAQTVERAEVVAAIDPDDIRSGDEVLDRDEPPAVTPAIPLEAGRNELGEASPWSGMWGPEIEPLAAYEPQTRCLSGARPGVAAFARLLERAYPQSRDLGISRACEAGARSEHKEGRAYDWGVRVTVPSERMAAEELVAWLLATDEHGNDFAMARRLGVMYVIWDGHIWSAGAADDGWRVYRGASPHTDHVHLSFSWLGAAGATSFWDAARLGPWLFGDVAVERLPSSFDLGRDRYRSELGDEPGAMRTWGVPPEPAPEAADEAEPAEAPAATDGAAPESPPPSPATTVAPAPAPAPTAPVGGLVGPVVDEPLPTLDPVDPVVAPPPTTVPLVDEVGDTVDDVVDDVEGTADSLVGG
jgi:hypothetical protein